MRAVNTAAAQARGKAPALLRNRSGGQRVTNIELFFDLVYVFAVTQLSHYLLRDANLRGALPGAGWDLGTRLPAGAACARAIAAAGGFRERRQPRAPGG